MKTKTSRLTVAAVQMRFNGSVDDHVREIIDRIAKVAARGADAVLFPECAVTGYNLDFEAIRPEVIEQALESIADATRKAACHVLVGSPTFTGGKRFNSLVVFDRRGRESFRYSKIHLTPRDARFFHRGNAPAFFHIDGVPCTAMICHERRYPELVRLPVMMGARIVFHPNAGLDTLAVSKTKRAGRDGIAIRAFENQVFYVFANSVGPQGDTLWSAGDSKIVAPDSQVLALADNRRAGVITADLDTALAGRRYAIEALRQPAFLRPHWKALLDACRRQLSE
ncbi:MAG: carbon-nitrogen hydrolase family protein [Limisphaerales bacterium]